MTTSTKNAIKQTYLAGKTMVSITPEIVDAGYICIIPTINVYWNPNITSSSASEIATKVRDVVQTYANNDIKNFDSVFRYSQFVNRIDLLMLVSFLTSQQLDAKDTLMLF